MTSLSLLPCQRASSPNTARVGPNGALRPGWTRARTGAAAALVGLMLALLAPAPAAAAGKLDLRDWLRRPGVKVVAVEFYATWCKPCMEAIPRWKALHEKYRDDGFRLIVVNTLDPGGGCAQVPWNPDQRLCDDDGFVGNSFGIGGNLPAAYVWTWQGNLLVKQGHIDIAEQAIGKYLQRNPRVVVEAEDAQGKPNEVLALMVRSEVQMIGKFDVVLSDEEKQKLAALRKASHGLGSRDDQRCTIGMEVSANSLLKARLLGTDKAQKLALSLNSAETGCLLANAWVSYSEKRAAQAVREAMSALTDKLRREPEHPKGGVFGGRGPAPDRPAPTEAKIGEGPSGSDWDPTAGQDQQAVVKFRSNPAGAVVLVDGRLLCKATPCSKAVEKGRHNVDMQLAEYMPKREVVEVRGSQDLVWDLSPDFAVLTVKTDPPDIPVIVDGKEVSGAQLKGMKVSAGPHEVVVDNKCFYKVGERIVAVAGETRTVELTPKPRPSAVRVRALDDQGNDLAASVSVDGKALEGTTPKVYPVPMCSKSVQVSHTGLQAQTESLALEEKQVKNIQVTLRKSSAAGLIGTLSGGVGEVKGDLSALSGKVDTGARREADECLAGKTASCNMMGMRLHEGRGLPQNRALALKMFLKACQDGYAISCGNAGNAYKNGWGTTKNLYEARRWHKTGCEKGHNTSCNELGLAMHFGHGGSQDRAEALRSFRRGCELGKEVACGNAGNAYKNGWGTAQNYIVAGNWYRTGCDKSHDTSCNELGVLYHFGRGYAQDRRKALDLFKKACSLGGKVSCSNVGNAYKNGWGVPTNRYEAKRYYQMACDKGMTAACKDAKSM